MKTFFELRESNIQASELDEMKEPFVVVDTADGNKVVGMASSEKSAKEIITTSQLPPMKIKNKKTLKIVKVKKKQMIGQPIKEEVELDEATWVKDVGRDSKSLVALAKKNGLKAKADGNEVTISGDRKMITRTMLDMRYAYQVFSKGFKEEVELDEGYSSMAQQRAVWATRKDGGKGHPDNKKKSKNENVNEISKDMASRYLKKVPASAADAGRKMTGGVGVGPDDQKKNMKKGINQFVNRNKGTSMAVDKMTGKAKVPATESVEETVNELDTSTLVSYRKKANKQRYSNNISKRIQRTAGVDRADKKLRKRNIDKFGDHSPKGVDRMGNRKEDSDAVKAFLAKGGKIKKLPPAKAQGYHGKDDPGKDIHGVMDRPDTKAMGTRKKIKSMESKSFFDLRNELSK